MDPQAADPLEYMHGGDTALVALQYSYLPSWVSFLVDQGKAADAGEALITAVSERWAALPEQTRPQLLLFGESLGSFGTESAFDGGISELLASVDGALLVGPVFQNAIHERLTATRDDGSPYWRPVYDDGAHVRFAVQPDDLTELPELTEPWGQPRVVYLQNSSDPITYWQPRLLWDRPAWLDEPRGPDVSSAMFWTPVVTFWQTAADMAFATGAPAGHGHEYGANPVDAWADLSAPAGWTPADTRQLRTLIGHD